MIIWYNCKITDQRRTPVGPRPNIRTDNRFDIARYTFASLVPLEPLISKLIFNLELDPPYAGREKEMEDWIRSLFPANKLSFHWFRCDRVAQWRRLEQEEIGPIDDDLIYCAGNEDHIFVDSDTSVIEKGLKLLSADTNPRAAMANCHYPEILRESFTRGVQLTECGNFVNYWNASAVGIVVTKKVLYQSAISRAESETPNKMFYCVDSWWPEEYYARVYGPTKELFRHYDGYNHTGMDNAICPPVDIPLGFFEKNIVIRYGFPDRDPACVNINPTLPLYTADPKGTDYKWVLEDIPAFWHPYIKEIIVNKDINHEEMIRARNQYIVDLSRARHYGSRAPIPESWTKNHLIAVDSETK